MIFFLVKGNFMNKIAMSSMVFAVIVMAGCDSPEEREAQRQHELECVKLTDDRYCRNNQELQRDYALVAPHYDQRMVDYGPVQPGQYHNYYGNPQYGTWGSDGRYYFNDPNSIQASQTNAFLLGAGLGALGTYTLSKADFNKKNPNGWVDQNTTVKGYYGSHGEQLTQSAYQTQKIKSDQSRQAYIQKYNQQKLDYEKKIQSLRAQRDASLKQQQALNNQLKSQQTLSSSDIQKKKQEILQRMQDRQTQQALQAKNTTGFKSYTQTERNTQLKAQLRNTSYKPSGFKKASSKW